MHGNLMTAIIVTSVMMTAVMVTVVEVTAVTMVLPNDGFETKEKYKFKPKLKLNNHY